MKRTKPVREKPRKKINPTKYIMVAILVLDIVAGYYLYQWAFKSGYAVGTKNQIICQASEVQDSLKELCVK